MNVLLIGVTEDSAEEVREELEATAMNVVVMTPQEVNVDDYEVDEVWKLEIP